MHINRREWISAAGTAALATAALGTNRLTGAHAVSPATPSVRFCLNTGTIRGQNIGIVKEIEVAAQAGYDGIEPWLRTIEEYVEKGGSLKDLKKRLDDSGLKLESAIAFAQWIVDDPEARKKGLEQAAHDMDIIAQLGGKRIAAPPAGAQAGMQLSEVANRYRALLELGAKIGITPQLEIWGFAKVLSRLGEAAYVATEAAHPDACILPDIYHIYKGGSDFTGLQLINGRKIHVFHLNDYPATPPRDKITDADRVYTGDGIAPLKDILQMLASTGFQGVFSLELFNKEYYKQDPLQVARTGLEKMRRSAAEAFPVSGKT
ncbi:MAG: sugar phosphate isomerase/epimerase family protein [Planctomycetales bacterium]